MATPPSKAIPHDSVEVWTKYEYFKRNSITDAQTSICDALRKLREHNFEIQQKRSVLLSFKHLLGRPSQQQDIEPEYIPKTDESEETCNKDESFIFWRAHLNAIQQFPPLNKYPLEKVEYTYEKSAEEEKLYRSKNTFYHSVFSPKIGFIEKLGTHHEKILHDDESGSIINCITIQQSYASYCLRLEKKETSTFNGNSKTQRNLYWWHVDGCLKWDAEDKVTLIKGETFQAVAANEVFLCLAHPRLQLDHLAFVISPYDTRWGEHTPDLHFYDILQKQLLEMRIKSGRLIRVVRLTIHLWQDEETSPLFIILPHLQHMDFSPNQFGLLEIELFKWDYTEIRKLDPRFPVDYWKNTYDMAMQKHRTNMPKAWGHSQSLTIPDNKFVPDWLIFNSFRQLHIRNMSTSAIVLYSTAHSVDKATTPGEVFRLTYENMEGDINLGPSSWTDKRVTCSHYPYEETNWINYRVDSDTRSVEVEVRYDEKTVIVTRLIPYVSSRLNVE